MRIIEIHKSLWAAENIPTEYTAFKMLSRQQYNIPQCYIAAPWSVLINRGYLIQSRARRNLDFNKVANNAFTICQHISYEKIIPLLMQIGITTLFTPHAIDKDYPITVYPFPHYAANGILPQRKKLLCSFIGCLHTHNIRSIMYKVAPESPDIVMIGRKRWHYEMRDQEEREFEYKNVLAKSKFSLCPRGTGPSTIRFWESLMAGAIPVLISDTMMLPREWDWDNTIVRIPESDTQYWPQIIDSIPDSKVEVMRLKCLSAYEAYSAKNFDKYVLEYIGA